MNTEETTEKIIKTATHWARQDRELLPKVLHPTFDFVETEYFKEFKTTCGAHPQVLKDARSYLRAETIIRGYMKAGMKKTPQRYIIRNLYVACLDCLGDLNRNAIKSVLTAGKLKGRGRG